MKLLQEFFVFQALILEQKIQKIRDKTMKIRTQKTLVYFVNVMKMFFGANVFCFNFNKMKTEIVSKCKKNILFCSFCSTILCFYSPHVLNTN